MQPNDTKALQDDMVVISEHGDLTVPLRVCPNGTLVVWSRSQISGHNVTHVHRCALHQ